jgi:hypothetical protein
MIPFQGIYHILNLFHRAKPCALIFFFFGESRSRKIIIDFSHYQHIHSPKGNHILAQGSALGFHESINEQP